MTALASLKEVLAEVSDLRQAAELLGWDQETYMPAGGVQDRANQLGTLSRISHERFVAAGTGRLLEAAESEVAGVAEDSDDARLVRVARRDWDQETRLPSDLVVAMAREGAISRPVWQEAKAKGDWSLFAPRMRITVELAQRVAEAIGTTGRAYDALIDMNEPGLDTAAVEQTFSQLRTAIVPLLRRVQAHADRVDLSVLDREVEPAKQLSFSALVVERLGYDLQRGRQDLSAHPFCTSFGMGDVRITTRVKPGLREGCLFSSIHEAGHAMYEQGVSRALARTPLAMGTSPGVHESQSRLWENLVGRSRPFWTHFYPELKVAYGGALDDVGEEEFYRACNAVQPSYVRVDADELTYNLHVMLRFEIEKELLEGRLSVDEVPQAWAAQVKEYLGLEPPNGAEGPLQDIHWTFPILGGFIGYALGNVIGAQLMERARAELIALDDQIAAGDFAPLHGWLGEHVYRHGRKFTPQELVQKVTGRGIEPGPWMRYVECKFGDLYELN